MKGENVYKRPLCFAVCQRKLDTRKNDKPFQIIRIAVNAFQTSTKVDEILPMNQFRSQIVNKI